MNSDHPLLIVENVSKAFGGVQALSDVSFQLFPGTITGLIGPNGAGKTTLFNLITGIFPADTGDILFKGSSTLNNTVHELVQCGIARTFQNVELFESMTALENILVGQHARTRCGMWGSVFRFPWVRHEEGRATKIAFELLDFIGLKEHALRKSGDLAFGWQRLLELARALASGPRLLLLDEPAAGLNMVETMQLGDLIRKVRDQGITILLVEHDMSLTMEISDAIVVLDQGKKIAQGSPRSIQEDEAVMRAYLGTSPQK
ncbi:MAG: ABC transporter ATP-binding protein [Desulfobacterales bacterium]|jgi:branched-chain amino acid transport system ATP-binding protein|nr:ABC transporter ATP-binding protein [Desulfobacterales bacterium]